jgi:hypothetical protein
MSFLLHTSGSVGAPGEQSPGATRPSLDPSLPTRTPHYRPGTGGAAPLAKVTDLAGIRDAPALANLPADEQKAFTQLWADVAALLKKAAP